MSKALDPSIVGASGNIICLILEVRKKHLSKKNAFLNQFLKRNKNIDVKLKVKKRWLDFNNRFLVCFPAVIISLCFG